MTVLTGLTLRYTIVGRQLVFVGSNAEAARLVGYNTRRLLFASYIGSAAMASLAGVVLLARSGVGDPSAGPDYTLDALAAAFLGATAIAPGRFNVIGTVVGVFFVAVAVDGLTLLGAAAWVQPVFNGGAVIIAVTAAVVLRRRSGRSD
jgi:ribose transport system permease protein